MSSFSELDNGTQSLIQALTEFVAEADVFLQNSSPTNLSPFLEQVVSLLNGFISTNQDSGAVANQVTVLNNSLAQ